MPFTQCNKNVLRVMSDGFLSGKRQYLWAARNSARWGSSDGLRKNCKRKCDNSCELWTWHKYFTIKSATTIRRNSYVPKNLNYSIGIPMVNSLVREKSFWWSCSCCTKIIKLSGYLLRTDKKWFICWKK